MRIKMTKNSSSKGVLCEKNKHLNFKNLVSFFIF